MIQGREDLRFPTEAREALGVVREEIGQDLQRDGTIERRVVRFVHLSHSAGTDSGQHFVLAETSARGERHAASGVIIREREDDGPKDDRLTEGQALPHRSKSPTIVPRARGVAPPRATDLGPGQDPGLVRRDGHGMTVKSYVLSLPERVIRSALGLGAGVAREVGEVALPDAVRHSQLYRNLVDATLRFMIDQIGGVEGVYDDETTLPDKFLARRAAGNAIEVLGIVAFRASPVWVLAALADVCGLGRHLIPEIADALKAQGLLEKDAQFTSVDQMLDGLERTSSRLAATINAPPLDVTGLREEWAALREEARGLQPAGLPSKDTISRMWAQIKMESARQDRSVFETSSMMAVSAARAVPDRVRWLSASARVGATRTGQILAAPLLDHYRQALSEMQRVGYVVYASRQFRPYVRAAVDQFSPKRRTLTQRFIERLTP